MKSLGLQESLRSVVRLSRRPPPSIKRKRSLPYGRIASVRTSGREGLNLVAPVALPLLTLTR